MQPTTASITKIQRHPANSSTTCPMLGASIGTTRNTTDMIDICLAI